MTVTIDHAKRQKTLGCSELAKAMNLSPWGNSADVALEKRGLIEPWQGNEATKLGQWLEDAVLNAAEDEVGPIGRRQERFEKFPLSATIDGMTYGGEVVEAKTAGLLNPNPMLDEWGQAGTDEVPLHYGIQLQGQMLCTDADRAHLFALINGRGIVHYEIARSQEICDTIRTFVCDWWNRYVFNEELPEVTPSLEILKRVRRQPTKTTELDLVMVDLWSSREGVKQAIKSYDDQLKQIDAQIIAALGDAEAGILPDGTQITYLETVRKGYTVEPTTYRTLRLKKGK